ncbi:MAG: RdgB/HAM1 family non-canonical purine NTP pyrophosphatase [Halocynthiibacter sp.]
MRRLGPGKLVVASHNDGKIREIGALLAPHGVDVTSAAALALPEPDETENTFAANARIKAHFAARETGLVALSDDSGITVDALGGAPGVYTADWAETPQGRDFPMAMAKVWHKLEESGAPEPRNAAFNCTLCLAWPDGHDEIFEGIVRGRIVWPMRGSQGFGFDPVFQPDGESETFGEMEPARKHAMSHRADAFARLVAACFD